MTRINQPSAQTVAEAHAAGWIASLILHGALALGAFTFLQQITLAPQTASFTWNVAMVTPGPQTTVPSVSKAHRSAPPAPAAEPALKSDMPKTIADSQPMEPLPPIDRRLTAPQASRPIEEYAPSQASEYPSVSRTTDSTDPFPNQADVVPHAPATSASSLQTTSAGLLPSTQDETMAAHIETLSPEPATTSTGPQIASFVPTSQVSSTRSDDGWLRDLLAKWSEELSKHYPTTLRMDGIQGKVTVSALLHDDGFLSDVRIAKSSGNNLLDQAAMEAVKSGPPIKLSRPLGRPSKPVKIPIVYVLSDVR